MPPVTGGIPAEVTRAFEAGVFAVPPKPSPLVTSGAQSTWRVPVLMVGFSDAPLTYAPAEFDVALFDSTGATPTGSVHDYYRWASGGLMSIRGRVVAAVQLPNPASYYTYNAWGLNTIATPNNIYGMIRDALAFAPDGIDWSSFDMNGDGFVDVLWVVHAGMGGESRPTDRTNIWSITGRLSSSWRHGGSYITDDPIPGSTTQFIRIDRFSTLPELSGFVTGARSEIGVYCHEFGHALGLPDLYDTSQLGGAANQGPGNWSLMATGGWGGNGQSPAWPTHPGAWCTLFLGWRPAVRPSESGQVRLAPLAAGGDILELWFQGESNPEHFLLENRQRSGFDRNLPAGGLLISHVDEAAIGGRIASNRVNAGITPGLRMVEADGDLDLVTGYNRGDSSDPFPGALGVVEIDEHTTPNLATFSGGVTQLAIRNIANVGDDVDFTLQVEAPGWLGAIDAAAMDYRPVGSGPPPVALVAGSGKFHLVQIESRGATAQVVLRSFEDDAWQAPFQASATPGAALDHAAALIPGGDLAVVWSDTRTGKARLRYRTRLGDAWSQETEIATPPGDARHPAIAVDSRGIVNLAWLHHGVGNPKLMFMRFAYTSPFGDVFTVADTSLPGPPALALRQDQTAFIVWPDRDAPTPRLMFGRYHPDSGLQPNGTFTADPGGEETAPRLAVGADGALHATWLEIAPAATRIRYQRRPAGGPPDPANELVVSHGSAIENPALALDPQGGVHLAYERQVGGTFQVRYQRRREGHGWDLVGTNVTRPEDGNAAFPAVFPTSPGSVTLAYTTHPGVDFRMVTRRRVLDAPDPIASVGPTHGGPRPLLIRPNPVRAGHSVVLHVEGVSAAAGAMVDVYDLSGRRVAEIRLEGVNDQRFAWIGGDRTSDWAAGVYFARVRDVKGLATRLVVLR
jgi:immune inhibitor A